MRRREAVTRASLSILLPLKARGDPLLSHLGRCIVEKEGSSNSGGGGGGGFARAWACFLLRAKPRLLLRGGLYCILPMVPPAEVGPCQSGVVCFTEGGETNRVITEFTVMGPGTDCTRAGE